MSEFADFLVEIGSEELPPKALPKLSHALGEGIVRELKSQHLQHGTMQLFATPRRLAALIKDVQLRQPDREVERKGPALQAAFDSENQPTKACLGFAKSCGIEVSQLQHKETAKGTWLVHHYTEKGKQAKELLPTIVKQVLAKLPIPRPMRWGNNTTEFVRPVHWAVMLLGKDIIAAELLGQKTGRDTYGHRFHHPQAISLNKPSEYTEKLAKHGHVIASFNQRRDMIREQIDNVIDNSRGTAIIDEKLLDEVTALVEWPVALLCQFDKAFLKVPPEALISAMKVHQKCFHLVDKQQQLLPYFITISNIDSKDKQQVIAGNQRVMHARLSDAAFFYQTDCKQRLDSHLEGLKHVVFQNKLGSVYERAERISQLATQIALQIGADQTQSARAGLLSKCDLRSNMVGEFPELQGIMGYYYALHDTEAKAVALALKEQYLPRFSGDTLPTSTVGCAVALAERLDTLVGIFGINQAPTGDKDPFALRRNALGVLRIMIEKQFDLDLEDLLRNAINNYRINLPNQEVIIQTFNFMIERLRAWYNEQGVAATVFAAVLARRPTNPFDFQNRLNAVNHFRQLPEAQSLAIANKRVSNILKKENSNGEIASFAQNLLADEAEKILATEVAEKRSQVAPLYEQAKYTELLTQLASLRDPVDRFFDEVMVMVDDEKIRKNRLALLASLRNLFLQVADISLLQD